MKFTPLLTDVNLASIVFHEASPKLVLKFLNMTNGEKAGSLVCTGVVNFVYQTSSGLGLPQYCGEVDHALALSDEGSTLPQRSRDSSERVQADTLATKVAQLHYVRIEGVVSIAITCSSVQLL